MKKFNKFANIIAIISLIILTVSIVSAYSTPLFLKKVTIEAAIESAAIFLKISAVSTILFFISLISTIATEKYA